MRQLQYHIHNIIYLRGCNYDCGVKISTTIAHLADPKRACALDNMCMRGRVRACIRPCIRACVASMRPCNRANGRAWCVRAPMCARECVCVCARLCAAGVFARVHVF